jgi:hypothetical protein
MLLILSYMPRKYVMQLQVVSRRFYEILIPRFFHVVNIQMESQFLDIDFKNGEVRTFLVSKKLNPDCQWRRSVVKNLDP